MLRFQISPPSPIFMRFLCFYLQTLRVSSIPPPVLLYIKLPTPLHLHLSLASNLSYSLSVSPPIVLYLGCFFSKVDHKIGRRAEHGKRSTYTFLDLFIAHVRYS